MTTFTPNEIAGLIYLVGNWGPGSKANAPAFLDTAIAVCLAESGGNDLASNPSGATGLWQIMVSAHQTTLDQYAAQYGEAGSKKDYRHPLVNTATARDIQKAQGWQPWAVYTSGAYKKHAGHGASAYKWLSNKDNLAAFKVKMDSYGINWAEPKTAVDTSWQDIVKGFPSYMVDKLKDMGLTIGIFLIGVILVILGLWFLLAQNAGRVAKYTPQGAALKGLKGSLK